VRRLYSVIISGYKNTVISTLRECLQLDQTADVSYEVVLLDNTPDARHRESASAVLNSGTRKPTDVRYLSCPHPGKAAAQNEGIRRARGQVCVFLDDDVRPDKDLVLQYDEAFRRHSCGAVQGRVELLMEDDHCPPWLDGRLRMDLAEMDFGKEIIPFEMGLTGANMALKTDLFKQYGRFDERLGPGRAGTLADQEFSERIRRGGEVQLFWPSAGVKHRIPRERLTVHRFARTYYDVGNSEYFLSRHLIHGGKIKFCLYVTRQWLLAILRMAGAAVRNREADAVRNYCILFRWYGFWRQAMQNHWQTRGE